MNGREDGAIQVSLLLLFLLFALHGLVAFLASQHSHPMSLDVLARLAQLRHLVRELGVLAFHDGRDLFTLSCLLSEQFILFSSLREIGSSVMIVGVHLLVCVLSRDDLRVILLHILP